MKAEGKNTLNAKSLSTEALALALDEVRARLDEAEGRLAEAKLNLLELQQAIASDQQEERLLSQLVAVRKTPAPDAEQGLPMVFTSLAEEHAEAPSKKEAVEEVVRILEDERRTVHISELMRVLGERNIKIPGAGKQVNLISHLRRDSRVVRPSRGMYALASLGLDDMEPAPRKRKARRKKVRSGRVTQA